MEVLGPLLCDGYKIGHKFQYPSDTTLVYSNLTARGTRRDPKPSGTVAFGFQYFVKRYLQEYFRENFFNVPENLAVRLYQRRIDNYLGPGTDTSHIRALHQLQHLPLLIKAVPEGTIVPYRVPMLTIRNTRPEFYWLTNMIETLMSNILWMPITSATTALGYRRTFEDYAKKTGGDPTFVKWQGHDFSMRGLPGIEAAMLSGAAHLLSFTGTDSIPAIDFLETYYGADCEKELIGGSVPATEHSVMCMGLQDGELNTFRRLITEVYQKGIVSIVSDTWDLWKVCIEYLPCLKEVILAREGKVVIRPDSGDPVKILCGDPDSTYGPARAGVVRLLHKTFGGTTTPNNFIQLDPHIGTIYGDSITPERQKEILERLLQMGFASTNVVLGIGSYTYQHVTRDTDGMAMKATYGETLSDGPQAISKDPVTDSGLKKSAKGLLQVVRGPNGLVLHENVTWNAEDDTNLGVLQPIFKDGVALNFQTLAQIRTRVESQL